MIPRSLLVPWARPGRVARLARRGREYRRPVGLVAVLMVAAVSAAGCGGPGGGATTNDDVGCAAVLPLARTVVHGRGRIVVIRRINKDDAEALDHEAGVTPPPPPTGPKPPKPSPAPTTSAGPPPPKTCLVVYQGSYPAGSVDGAQPPANAGMYALITLRVRHPKVNQVLVVPRLPSDTTHRPWWKRVF